MKSKELNFSKKNNRLVPLSSSPLLSREQFAEESIQPISRTKNLDLSSQNQKVKKVKKKRNKKRLVITLFIFVAILGILSALFVYFIFIPGKKVYDSAENIKSNFYSLISDVQNKDISNLDQYLENVKNEIDNINKEIDKFDFLASWDQTKGYYDNFQQAQVILNKSDNLITETLPELKEVLEISGFKVDSESSPSSTNESEATAGDEEDGAITLILKQLPQFLNLYNEIEPEIIDIFKEVKKLNPDYIPQIAGFDVTDNLAEFNKFADEFPQLSAKTVNFIKEMPELLGSNQDTTYLVILQNETEMRSSGGLLTSFGTIKVSKGEIEDEISLTDTWQIQYDMWRIGLPMPRNNIYGQSYLMNHNCGATEARAQDLGIYPDLNVTMTDFMIYYDRAKRYFPEKYPEYDHVLILNYAFSENLLELVQPLEIEGLGQATAENLYDFIKNETDNPEIFFDEDRKKVIKDLAKEAKKKLLNLGMPEIPNLLGLIVGSFQAKDIAFASKNENMQAYFDEYGMSGRTAEEFQGDYFQLSEAQNCSLKLNKFIRDTVDLTIDIADDGAISNSAQVKWLQTKVYEEGLDNQYSPTLQFSYRAWVRFILAPDSEVTSSDGFTKSGYLYYYPKSYYDDILNKEVSDNIVQFDHRRFSESDPIERKDMNVKWNVPTDLSYETLGRYKLLIQKHPGKSWGEKYTININHEGSQYSVDFTLDRDKVVSYKDGVISVENYEKGLDWIIQLSNKIPWGELNNE